jgi:ABC-type sugar transport system ATPase subunit
MRKVSKADRERSVQQAAQMLNITPLLERYPAELSGGEQQRVAMGRAIVRSPEVFLFDEPLSNLDAALRSELRVELKKLLRRLDATALYVTHDQVEAMTLSDRICVLNQGKLEQIASPRTIYEDPASVFVAGFFGSPPMNLLTTEQTADTVSVGSLSTAKPAAARGPLVLGFRPEVVRLSSNASPPGDAVIVGEAEVTAVEPLGAETGLELAIAGQGLRTKVPGFEAPQVGDTVKFEVPVDHLKWFDQASGQAL